MFFCSWNLELKKKNISTPSPLQQDLAQIKSFVRLFFLHDFNMSILDRVYKFQHEKSWTKPLLMPWNPDGAPPFQTLGPHL